MPPTARKQIYLEFYQIITAIDKVLPSECWVGRILSFLYFSLFLQIPLNSQMCSWFVHMKVAFDLVE